MYRCESFNKIFTQKVPGVLTKTNDEIIKIDDIYNINNINNTIFETMTMDYSEKTRDELIVICKEKGIRGYSGKKKDEIAKLLMSESFPENVPIITQSANYST